MYEFLVNATAALIGMFGYALFLIVRERFKKHDDFSGHFPKPNRDGMSEEPGAINYIDSKGNIVSYAPPKNRNPWVRK